MSNVKDVNTRVLSAVGFRFVESFANMSQRAVRAAAHVYIDSVLHSAPEVIDNSVEYLLGLKRVIKEITQADDYEKFITEGVLEMYPDLHFGEE